MPSALLRPCAAPNCPELVQGGKCDAHRLQHEGDWRGQRGTTSGRGYGWRWQQRAKLFKERHPLCGMRPNDQRPVMSVCFDHGIATRADQVDHVVPHRGNQALFWDEQGNWQALCASCGAAKSAKGF